MKRYIIYITKYNYKIDKYEEISFKVRTNRIEDIIGQIIEKADYPIVKIDYEEIKKNG